MLPGDVNKRVALVTGAASGLGAAFAECLAGEQFDLVLVDRDSYRLQQFALDLDRQFRIKSHCLIQDLTRPEAASNLATQCTALGLSVDFLVNNAGFHLNRFLHELPLAQVDDNLQLLLHSVVEITHQFAPAMIRSGWGRIINVASVSGFMPGGVRVATYNSSKAFMIHFSEALDEELKAYGVRVTAICPGFMHTNLFANSGLLDVRDTVPSFLWSEPSQVAREGYRAAMDGRTVYIAGRINKAIITAAKFTPRLLLRERMRLFHSSVYNRVPSGKLSPTALTGEGRRIALVTGATSGIGASFCTLLAAQGYNLITVARRRERLEEQAMKLAKLHGVEVYPIAQDLSAADAVEVICTQIGKKGWAVDLLVNNAAYPVNELFVEMTWPQVAAALQIYLKTMVQLTHQLLPEMIARRKGWIINIASMAAFEPGSYRSTLYSGAKAFLVCFSESIAAELDKTGVTVTAVCPGFTRTEWQTKNELKIASLPSLLWMDSDKVARTGFNAAMRGVKVCVIGTWALRMIFILFQIAPRFMVRSFLSKKRRALFSQKDQSNRGSER